MESSTRIAAAIVFVATSFGGDSSTVTKQGVGVLLADSCPNDVLDNRRDLVVRYLPGPRLFLNGALLEEEVLRSTLQTSLATRAEPLVWVAGDERVSYGEVVSIMSKLSHDSPRAHIVLVTKAQVGPVDPLDRNFPKAQMNPKLGVSGLCVRLGR
jgi:biopolymer transport protein ExbD